MSVILQKCALCELFRATDEQGALTKRDFTVWKVHLEREHGMIA